MKRLICPIILMLFIPLGVSAANSLVQSGDINKMKKAGVSQNLIEYLLTHQTCSINAETVIRYHQAGIKEKEILHLIQTDAYRPERKSTIEKELKIIEGLKQAGFSDRAILEYMNTIRSTQLVDLNGNRSYRLISPMKQSDTKKEQRNRAPYPLTLELNK
jgi:urocanate hydratase